MKKAEAERAIRSLCHDWFKTLPEEDRDHPGFGAFTAWMRANGYGSYLDFRSTGGANEAAEWWFDQELKQTWRR